MENLNYLTVFIFSKAKKDFKREELSVIVGFRAKTHCTFQLVWIWEMKYCPSTTSGLVLLRNAIKEGSWNGLIDQYILHHREGRHVFYLRIDRKYVDAVYCYYLWAHEALIKDSLIPENPNSPSDNQQKILILLVHRRWHQSLKCVLNYSPC